MYQTRCVVRTDRPLQAVQQQHDWATVVCAPVNIEEITVVQFYTLAGERRLTLLTEELREQCL